MTAFSTDDINDTLHRTDTLNPCKDVTCGPQKKNWIEYQLLDEQGEPVADIPYRAVNEATRTEYVSEYTGQSDAEGLIRIEGLHPLDITLLLDAERLAAQLQHRRLGALRPEPPRPGAGDRMPMHGPQCTGFSNIEMQVRAEGHAWHYLRIGQVCDQLPDLDPPLADPSQLPAFHFPDPDFKGFTVSDSQLNRRHVLELCPFRAWSLLLHHQQEYSLANAYNLGLMSILAYSTAEKDVPGSVQEFFDQQCLDLSRTPRVWDNGQGWPSLVIDVPFSDRYTLAEPLDTTKAEPPEGDTQLFYAISASQVLVAWRGTELNFPFTDLATDLTFRPVDPVVQEDCEPSVPCIGLVPEGRMHLGFRDAFKMAQRIFARQLGRVIPEESAKKQLFICGHSLGGALALIHAATLQIGSPLLYTYGMPRTFTLKALQSFDGLWHFRHVNDTDIIPRVPFEADLDNNLYDIYGPMGTLMGFHMSVRQVLLGKVLKGDPYSHHGKLAMFLRAEQHMDEVVQEYPAYNGPNDPPHFYQITRKLPIKAKLYLVPSLDDTLSQQAEDAQKNFTADLSVQSRSQYFPPNGNPLVNGALWIAEHFMSKYQPYIHNQLLELINPHRRPLLERQVDRQGFEQQMKDHYGRIPAHEYARNQAFLDLHNSMGQALYITSETEGGAEALQRFDAIADPQAYYEKVYG